MFCISRASSAASGLTVIQGVDRPRAMLINNGKGIPLLWQALSNKYKDHISFGVHRDRHHKSSVALGFEAGPKGSSKVLIYPAGSTEFIRYEGTHRHNLFPVRPTPLGIEPANVRIAAIRQTEIRSAVQVLRLRRRRYSGPTDSPRGCEDRRVHSD